jgi:hypothetical protein
LGKFTRINHPAARPVDSSEFNHFHTSEKIGRQEGIPPKEQKMSEKAREARRKLFESAAFRDEAAERLSLKGAMVTNAVGALLAAGSTPSVRSDNAEALGVDGANLLLAIGSQVRPDAIARVTKRFAAMTLQIDAEKPKGAAGAGNRPQEPVTFEDDLTAMFQHSWKAAHSGSLSSINAMGTGRRPMGFRPSFGFFPVARGRGNHLFAAPAARLLRASGRGRRGHRGGPLVRPVMASIGVG